MNSYVSDLTWGQDNTVSDDDRISDFYPYPTATS